MMMYMLYVISFSIVSGFQLEILDYYLIMIKVKYIKSDFLWLHELILLFKVYYYDA